MSAFYKSVDLFTFLIYGGIKGIDGSVTIDGPTENWFFSLPKINSCNKLKGVLKMCTKPGVMKKKVPLTIR